MKIKKLIFFLLILSVLILTGCGSERTSQLETLKMDSTISYSDLKMMAVEPKYEPAKNYKIEAKMCDFDAFTYGVPALGSELIVSYDSNSTSYTLINYISNKVISENIHNNIYCSTLSLTRINDVYYDRFLPFVIFKYLVLKSYFKVSIFDKSTFLIFL